MSADLSMTLEAFVRSISINRDTPHSLFLGAGASITSGIPSAERCTIEWKARIFTSANPGLEKQVSHLSLPSVQRRIQTWLDKQPGFPPAGHASEYSFFFEHCYPLADDRRAYFQSLVKAAYPGFGYQLLVLMAEAGVFDSLWTTNFDGLPARTTVGSAMTAIEIGLDTTARIERLPRKNELLCVALHGDFRYDLLKNTEQELQVQDAKLRESFAQHLRERTVIIVGYSGRDQSVMECLRNAVQQKGVGRLFWCGFHRTEPPPLVAELIETARRTGRQAFYVNSNGFDDTMRRLTLQCLEGTFAKRGKDILALSGAAKTENNKPFSLARGQPTALIKSNCFPLDCPSEVYQFEVPDLHREGAWAALRETLSGKEIAGGILGRNVVAIGLLDDIKAAFENRIQGEVGRSPIAEYELGFPNGTITGVLRQGLVRSLAQRAGLETDGNELLWEKNPYKTPEIYRWKCAAYRAVIVSLKRSQGRQYVTLMPTVFGKPQRSGELPDFVAKELKRQILSNQFNKEFNDELELLERETFSEGGGRTRISR